MISVGEQTLSSGTPALIMGQLAAARASPISSFGGHTVQIGSHRNQQFSTISAQQNNSYPQMAGNTHSDIGVTTRSGMSADNECKFAGDKQSDITFDDTDGSKETLLANIT